MKKSNIERLAAENAFELIGKEWMLITAGTPEKFNTMTASWGGIGYLWNRPVAFIFVRPERYTYEFIENQEQVTLAFLGNENRQVHSICGSKSGREKRKHVFRAGEALHRRAETIADGHVARKRRGQDAA